MTTETETIEVTLEEKLSAAIATQAQASAEYAKLGAGEYKSLDLKAQMAIGTALMNADAAVETAQKAITSRDAKAAAAKLTAEREAREATVIPAVKAIEEQVKRGGALATLANALTEAHMDGPFTFAFIRIPAIEATETEPAKPASFDFVGRMPTTRGASNGATAGTGSGTKEFVTPTGVYGSTDYLRAYLPDALANGTVKWGTFEERMAFTKDHSTRGQKLASLLGHEVRNKAKAE